MNRDDDVMLQKQRSMTMNENLYEVSSGVTDILRGPQPKKAVGKGSVVTLKSGGPAMTVIDRTADNAHCTWHKDDSEIVSVWVPILALKVKE